MFQKGEVITLVVRLKEKGQEFEFKAMVGKDGREFVLHRSRVHFGPWEPYCFDETRLCGFRNRFSIGTFPREHKSLLPLILFPENDAPLKEYRAWEHQHQVFDKVFHVRYQAAYQHTMTFLMAAKYLPIDKNIVQMIARKLYVPDRVEIKF